MNCDISRMQSACMRAIIRTGRQEVGFFAYVAIPLRESHQALVAPTSYLPIGSFPHSVIFTGDNSAGNGGGGHFSGCKYGLINTALSRETTPISRIPSTWMKGVVTANFTIH
jgi:hypothetical protein